MINYLNYIDGQFFLTSLFFFHSYTLRQNQGKEFFPERGMDLNNQHVFSWHFIFGSNKGELKFMVRRPRERSCKLTHSIKSQNNFFRFLHLICLAFRSIKSNSKILPINLLKFKHGCIGLIPYLYYKRWR